MVQTNEQLLPDDLISVKPEKIEEYCKNKGEIFAKGEDGKFKVSTSKLRNFFAKVISLRTYYRNPGKDGLEKFYNKLKREIILLKPLLAYAYGRDKDLKNFFIETTCIIDKTIKSFHIEYLSKKEKEKENENEKGKEKEDAKIDISLKFESLENFFAILEGFVAYHKFYGGKD